MTGKGLSSSTFVGYRPSIQRDVSGRPIIARCVCLPTITNDDFVGWPGWVGWRTLEGMAAGRRDHREFQANGRTQEGNMRAFVIVAHRDVGNRLVDVGMVSSYTTRMRNCASLTRPRDTSIPAIGKMRMPFPPVDEWITCTGDTSVSSRPPRFVRWSSPSYHPFRLAAVPKSCHCRLLPGKQSQIPLKLTANPSNNGSASKRRIGSVGDA